MHGSAFADAGNALLVAEDVKKLSEAEQHQYVVERMICFNSCFEHQSAGVRFPRESLELFALALSHSFTFFTRESVGHLLECLVHLHGCLSCIPNSESYLSLCSLSVAKCHSRDSFKRAMMLLFLEKDFCVAANNGRVINQTYNDLAGVDDLDEIVLLLDPFLTPVFVDVYGSNPSCVTCDLFELILECGAKPCVHIELLLCFAKFVAAVFRRQRGVIEDLCENGLIVRVNALLAQSSSEAGFQFYRMLLSCYDQTPEVHPQLVKHAVELYRQDNASMEMRVSFLKFFFVHDQWLEHLVADSAFHLVDLFVPSVLQDEVFLATYVSFVSKLSLIDIQDVLEALRALILELAPPMKDGMLYDHIFQWLLSMCSSKA